MCEAEKNWYKFYFQYLSCALGKISLNTSFILAKYRKISHCPTQKKKTLMAFHLNGQKMLREVYFGNSKT